MSTREPSDETVLAARIQRAYPGLNPYQSASLARDLGKIERAQRRHAERCCNGADGGYVRRRFPSRDDDCAGRPMVIEHDQQAEVRAGNRIGVQLKTWTRKIAEFHGLAWTAIEHTVGNWRFSLLTGRAHREVHCEWIVETEGDPRGAVLKVRFPGETEARSA